MKAKKGHLPSIYSVLKLELAVSTGSPTIVVMIVLDGAEQSSYNLERDEYVE